MKNWFPLTIVCSFLATLPVFSQTALPFKMTHETNLGPQTPDEFPTWLAGIKRWRVNQLAKMDYNGAEYDRPELKWTQSSFVQPQMMVEDRYFYDPVAGKYTVDRYLDDLEKRYGKIDSVLV